jgi:ABC-type branched-subunit amino acid transport system substrate-binding protein/outer membrane protein OmpA-like peptidoglycan-associated protein
MITKNVTKIISLKIVLLISACGGGSDGDSEAKGVKTADENTIVIGVAWPNDDDNFVKGAQLARKEINRNKEMLTGPLQLLINDGEKAALDLSLTASKKITLDVANSLVANPAVVAVIGHRFSNFAIQAADIYSSHSIVFIAPTLTNLNLTGHKSGYVFRVLPNNEQMGKQLATYCYKAGYKKIVVLHSQDNYGRELANAFVYNAVENNGAKIVTQRSFLPNQTDFTDLMVELNGVGEFDAIFVATEAASVATRIYQDARQKDIMVPFVGGNALNSEPFWKVVKKMEVSDKFINKSAVPTVFNTSVHQGFIKKFKEEYGEQAEPDNLAALGYDSVKLLAHGMKRARSSVPGKFTEMLQSMPSCQGVIGQHRFRVGGNVVNRKLYFKHFRDGQFEYKDVDEQSFSGQQMLVAPSECGHVDRDKDDIFNDVDVCPDNSEKEISKGVYQQGDFRGCPVDSDKDGYHDYRDVCPNTLKHEFEKGIDSLGCPMDTDGDGVPDYKDSCSDNLLKSKLVNDQGCAPDADHDDVFDDKDICPNNKPEELSKGIYLQGAKAGCPIDSDEDGVPDYRDNCIKNSQREIRKGVDLHGCPIDTDKDDIPNYEDVCSDNSQQEISSGVYQQGDEIGCPLDSDNDSVPDYRDRCPKNQPEEIEKGIYPQGCPIDADKDGVSDYFDDCPKNSHFEIRKGVGSRGCPVDTDHDRVPDYNDVCFKNSAKEISKGVYQQGTFLGCPVDSDQDGVPDYRDDCLKNSLVEIGKGVDLRGCPPDTDKDGVSDYKDVCIKNSPEEISKGVFQRGTYLGCPIDNDQDGVPDYRDNCPKNRRLEIFLGVDSHGCPLDIDKDGILDYKDVCVNNSLEEISKGVFKKGIYLGCPMDSDKDGVPNYRDNCPKTRRLKIIQRVDSHGCLPDIDKDGIPDYKDVCVNNSLEEISKGVSQQKKAHLGCPIDSDNDGVADYRDDCPKNSPVEISKNVDSRGCPVDTDQDGVPDYKDVCFNDSPKALSKGIYQEGIHLGCPIDSDSDGVPDFRDDCVENSTQEIRIWVNLQGCLFDTDKDGIPDYKDVCINNSSEEISKGVFQQEGWHLGCPIDHDGDGVSDYRDDCQKNSNLEISKGVNSRGCPVDTDHDNVPDYRDNCPKNRRDELKKGVNSRGCPTDTDKDTVSDYKDVCPKNSSTELSKGVFKHGTMIGCPLDSDKDKVPDYRDDCPKNRRSQIRKGVNLRGCPVDTDKDSVPDYKDLCEGTRLEVAVDPKGCAIVLREKIVRHGKMSFLHKEKKLTEEAQVFLQTLVKRIDNSFLRQIEVIGHTDSIGTHSSNRELSFARANTVAEYLILQGIPGEKIQKLGMGETHPIASNQTEADREKNRRICLRVTQFKKR